MITVLDTPESSFHIYVSEVHVYEFQALIQAGSATNPDLSPALKEFCDIVTTGKVQQDYYAQANIKRPD